MTQPPTGPDQPDQQPEQPQDPYGAPPPPPTYPPSYGSPYGGASTPPPPQYGSPSYPPPTGQPYGAPSGYPPAAFPGGEQGPPSKGMAIGALVSSFLCCLPVGLVLGIIVLRRGRDGRDHGKGLAIAAIVVNVLVMLASLVLVVVAVVAGSQIRAVDDLQPGDCISGDGLRGDAASFSSLTEEDCAEPHDAEVMGTFVLTSQDLEDHPDSDYGDLCDEAVADDPDRAEATLRDDVSLLVIYDGEEPGDTVACLALAADGGQLDEPLVD